MIDTLQALVDADEMLIHRGRFVTTSFLLEIGETAWLLEITKGRISNVTRGPFVMPRWTFALSAAASDWNAFWSPSPPPGFHDLFALLRFKRLAIEGDMHVFMANLFYFKQLLAKLRRSE